MLMRIPLPVNPFNLLETCTWTCQGVGLQHDVGKGHSDSLERQSLSWLVMAITSGQALSATGCPAGCGAVTQLKPAPPVPQYSTGELRHEVHRLPHT